MDIKDLEHLASQFGSVVILRNDKPAFVVLPFEKYQELLKSDGQEILVKHFSKAVENGLPATTNLISSMEHLNFSQQQPDFQSIGETEEIERLNRDIASLKEEILTKEGQDVVEAESI